MHPLGLVLLGAITLAGMLWVRSQPPKQRRMAFIKLGTVLVALMLIYLAITGRLHWLGALVALALPFLRNLVPLIVRLLPFLGSVYARKKSAQQSAGNRSEVKTQVLAMTLDHDSGVMYGTVLTGPYAGHELGNMSEVEFLELLQYCRQTDSESTRLLEAYLDKRFGDRWRQDDTGASQQGQHSTSSATMSREEAYQILGLSPEADEAAIIDAHRRLMQKLHPDRGGSDYLAAQINRAKDLLLNS